MESVTGESRFLRISRRLVVVGAITIGLSGCAFTPQAIELQPKVNVVESSIGQGRVVYVNVVDERGKTTLGIRGAGVGADLTLKGDLRTIIRSSTIGGLTRQGFSPTMETVPGARELRVEVRSLDYQVIRGFWQGTLRTTCSLKAICKQGTAREYERLHNGKYEVGVQVVQSDDRNTRFVNTAVSRALNEMLGDKSLMECLAAPAHTTSAAAGAASAPAVAVSKPKEESKQNTTADGKTVAETLAALKVLHGQGVLSDEEYMRKQRGVINEHTRTVRANLQGDKPLSTVRSSPPQESSPSGAAAATVGVTSEKEDSESIPSIAVAVFPFARSGMAVTNDADHLLPEFAHRYVSENRQLRLSESYFKQDGSKIRGKSNYWSATNRPLDSQIYSDGARIGADVILMYSYSGRYGSEDRFDVTVYLFDVKNRRAYQSNGNQDNYKRVTESLFREITATTVSSNLPQESPASGAAAAATVTVAAVKDEAVAERSESTRGTRSLGLLPIKLLSSGHVAHLELEFEVGRELQSLLAKADNIKVEYSAYDGNSIAFPDTEPLWEAQLFHPNVQEKQLRQLGKRLGVDFVVAAWLGVGYQPGSENLLPWPLDLFVLRVRDGELRVFKTNNKSMGPVVQELIAFIRL